MECRVARKNNISLLFLKLLLEQHIVLSYAIPLGNRSLNSVFHAPGGVRLILLGQIDLWGDKKSSKIQTLTLKSLLILE